MSTLDSKVEMQVASSLDKASSLDEVSRNVQGALGVRYGLMGR